MNLLEIKKNPVMMQNIDLDRDRETAKVKYPEKVHIMSQVAGRCRSNGDLQFPSA